MPLPVRWRYKLDRWRSQIAAKMNTPKEQPRPRICPACGTLVGAGTTRCHQCGTNLSFSLSAASRSLGKYMPQTSPVSYGILSLCCILYGVGLLSTIHQSGLVAPGRPHRRRHPKECSWCVALPHSTPIGGGTRGPRVRPQSTPLRRTESGSGRADKFDAPGPPVLSVTSWAHDTEQGRT